MSVNQLMNDLESMRLNSESVPDGNQLLFKPNGSKEAVSKIFEKIPRYLFRIFHPDSCCISNETWMKSKDAVEGNPNAATDCFDRSDKPHVAKELNRHLRWQAGMDDNFVSWTSSLLFAIQYACYLAASIECPQATLETIDLCIIDTTSFSRGVFVQDMDLIKSFTSFGTPNEYPNERDLIDLEKLRNRKHNIYRSTYYFGEYLSQGSLKVEGHVAIVSMANLARAGLPVLQPKFDFEHAKNLSYTKNEWANKVCQLREDFYSHKCCPLSQDQVLALIAITKLFEQRWAVGLAVNLVALQPRPEDDPRIAEIMFRLCQGDGPASDPLPAIKMVPLRGLPEVKQAQSVLESLRLAEDFFRVHTNSRLAMEALRLLLTGLDSRDFERLPPLLKEPRKEVEHECKEILSLSTDLSKMLERGLWKGRRL